MPTCSNNRSLTAVVRCGEHDPGRWKDRAARVSIEYRGLQRKFNERSGLEIVGPPLPYCFEQKTYEANQVNQRECSFRAAAKANRIQLLKVVYVVDYKQYTEKS